MTLELVGVPSDLLTVSKVQLHQIGRALSPIMGHGGWHWAALDRKAHLDTIADLHQEKIVLPLIAIFRRGFS